MIISLSYRRYEFLHRKLRLLKKYHLHLQWCEQVRNCTQARERVLRVSPRQFLCSSQNARLVNILTEENQYVCLANVTTPLWKLPYDEQLKLKHQFMEKCLKIPLNIIKVFRPKKQSVIDHLRDSSDGMICPFEEVLPSPVIDGYRNKNVVCVGTDINGNDKTVGLQVGKPSRGAALIVNLKHLKNMSEKSKEITMIYQDFVRQSSLPGWKLGENEACWADAIMRINTPGEAMLSVLFKCPSASEVLQEKAKQELYDYFSMGAGKDTDVKSLHFTTNLRRFTHLYGQTHLYEEMLGMKFRISPGAFFQINTKGAEVLYSTVVEMANIKSSTVVLDVCCGTGTIGIILSKFAKHVIGVEMITEAVEDAICNAKINDAKNIEFVACKAHRLLEPLSSSREFNKFDDVVAVVNPGRSGINRRVVNALRQSVGIKKLVYISCKPIANAAVNFADLMMLESEDYPGKPFISVKAKAVDMFPHTKHCELVILFERCDGT